MSNNSLSGSAPSQGSVISTSRRVGLMYGSLVLLHIVAWGGALLAARTHPVILGLAFLAYGFGLRHAVDPDHIAAIDNTTRKLMQSGERPVAVGYFFSLGHSTVVVALSALVALSASLVHRHMPAAERVGSLLGTSASCLFLLLIGGINLVALWRVKRTWRAVVRGEPYKESDVSGFPAGGVLARVFRRVLNVAGKSAHMYPIGFLFGLGFDTASEVALLGLSASTGAGGAPLWVVLLLPLLFTAGMAVVDTTDGVLMLRAYGWAYVRPIRKLYYNMTITGASVAVALFIGIVEGVQVIVHEVGVHGAVWDAAAGLQLNVLGFFIVGVCVASWLMSMLVYRLKGYDRLDGSAVDRVRPEGVVFREL